MRYVLAAVAAGIVALTGCSSDQPPTATEVRDQLGCVSFWADSSQEMFVKDKYTCMYGDHQTAVYMFKDDEARDSWRQVAEHFGTHVLHEGDGWLEVKH